MDMHTKKAFAVLPAAAALIAAGSTVVMPAASAHDATTYQAKLSAINGSGASGSFWLSLHGDKATVTEKVSGLASTFMGAPYPHVQHIHGDAMGMCPTSSADTSKDGVISTTEGAPHYGKILTTLSKTGDTSPAAGTDVKVAPSGSSYTYQRTITLSDAAVKSLKSGTAVIVVHGPGPGQDPGEGTRGEERPGALVAAGRDVAGAVRQSHRSSDEHHAVRRRPDRWRRDRRRAGPGDVLRRRWADRRRWDCATGTSPVCRAALSRPPGRDDSRCSAYATHRPAGLPVVTSGPS